MGTTAIKHPMPDRVKLSFVIFDIRALWRSVTRVRVPGCQKLQMTADSLSRSGTECFVAVPIYMYMATVGLKELSNIAVFKSFRTHYKIITFNLKF